MLVAVAEVVLAELTGRISEILQELRDVWVLGPHAEFGPREPNLGQARAQATLAGYERRAACRAALLAVIVGEEHSFFGNAVDVGRAIPHQTPRVDTEVGLPDVVPPENQEVRFLVRRHHTLLLRWTHATRGCLGRPPR